ncbi:YgeY family selenium metabolism-linked hydrolase [Polycladidibacter stylochi]|uniref:YgeY family selenium metabolism-linked hydrolase n=1 Tax=Polycladidibacter stylochi TaxID=1807766 RepID=UPI00082D153A|nr:YgeY family selenium metabolism-linked hydrolase [Pseudovibrio stylochi]
MGSTKELCLAHQTDITEFLKKLISIESYTGQEEAVAKCVEEKMIALGYDSIIKTEYGDVVGVMGSGETAILFDSHMDTVVVNDRELWSQDPFAGNIVDGKIYGRGTSDMKSAIAATVYAGYFAKELGLLDNKTVYVSASVMEEDFDFFALDNVLENLPQKPDAVVICEPSDRQIALGHRGRALLEINTEGVSSHGSAPENGVNAVYEMADIINRVNELNNKLSKVKGEHGSVALSKIDCRTVSLNAIPDKCSIYLDRRLATGEDFDHITQEMNKLIENTTATWNVFQAEGTSYTGKEFTMHSFMESWKMEESDPITLAMTSAFESATDEDPTLFTWNFSTNGFASTARGIPTIGYGPGTMKLCHMRDENCVVQDIYDATEIYAHFISLFSK